MFDVLYCSSAAVFAVAVSLVGDVLWRRFGASVERLPCYLQELYQQAYDSAKAAYEESNSKLNNVVQFKPSTLQAMLALPAGDEEAFIEAQVQAGNPVENQSARQVQEYVKQWKEAKSKEVSETVSNEFNLFADEYEVADRSQSVDESEENIVIESESTPTQNPELTSPPTEQREDEVAPADPIQSFIDEENLRVELEKKRAETQKLLDEISMLVQTAAATKLDETIRELKTIRAVLDASCWSVIDTVEWSCVARFIYSFWQPEQHLSQILVSIWTNICSLKLIPLVLTVRKIFTYCGENLLKLCKHHSGKI